MSKYNLEDFRHVAEQLWPAWTAQSWDRVGLVTGRNSTTLTRVLLAVDAVEATVNEAVTWGADLLFTHHPMLLRGVHSICEDTSKGALLARLIRAECALFAAHTNADQPEGGVSAVFAERLGLTGVEAIEPAEGPRQGEVFGIGRVGELSEPVTLREFADRVSRIIPTTVTGVRVAGDPSRRIRRVSVLPGAGDSLLDHPLVRSADVYVTSDLRHHPAQESLETAVADPRPALIDVSHWASEWVWLNNAAQLLASRFDGIEFQVSQLRTDPWTFSVGADSSTARSTGGH